MLIGILAIQGGYARHAAMLEKLGVQTCYVRTAEKLKNCDGLVIPGGESTTLLFFMNQQPGLWQGIQSFAAHGKPIFGTCAGAILLAREVTHPPQKSLNLIDMTVERNSYGRQLASQVSKGLFLPHSKQEVEMVFIRAPRIKAIGKKVKIVGRCENQIVCVQQGKILAATFHPELSIDTVWHEYFLTFVKQ
jgi:5'-phosphate synthase pdxT subunit